MKCSINRNLLLKIFTVSFFLSFSILIIFNVALGYASTDTNDSEIVKSYWSSGASMPEERNELTAVVLDGMIYAIGGQDYVSDRSNGGTKDTVDVYDIARDKWIENEIAPLPLPLHHSASAVYKDKIYVVGGYLDERKVPSDKLFIYDPKINEWHEGKSLPTRIGGALNAQFVNGILYVMGGTNASYVPVDTNFAYNPKTDRWDIKSPMPTPRHHLQTVVMDGKIFAMGGRILGDGVRAEDINYRLTNFDRIEIYNPQTDSWSIHEPMLTKKSGFAATVPADGNIYVFGGEDVEEITDSVEKYDPVLDKWTSEKSMPDAGVGIEAVPFNDRIYVLGGVSNEIFHIGKPIIN
jgi:N-acetylneuraminic acid mutarotase